MITITRNSGYIDRFRKYKVVVDGEVIGTLTNGETKSFDINAGKHALCLTVDWARSNVVELTASDSDEVKFKCSSSLRGFNVFRPSKLNWDNYIILERKL